jgi:dihydrofolate reductase
MESLVSKNFQKLDWLRLKNKHMKVIQYLAISVNGHITVGEDGTDWVTPQTIADFGNLNKESGIVVMGKRTYEMFGPDFPQKNCLNVVMTRDSELLRKQMDGALFTDKSPKGIIQLAEEKGFKRLFLVGGTQTNTTFLKDNLIDEVWINVIPVIIGHGKYLFSELSDISIKDLELYESKPFEGGQMLLKYKIKK